MVKVLCLDFCHVVEILVLILQNEFAEVVYCGGINKFSNKYGVYLTMHQIWDCILTYTLKMLY